MQKSSINRAKIDTSLLAAQNLEPRRLTEHLQQFQPESNKFFSSDENWLYFRMLSETSQTVIDIASQMPRFTERTLSEILKREATLLEIATEILQRVEDIRKSSRKFNNDQNSIYFETEYRRNIERKLGKLQLFGVEASIPSTKYGLSVAYVTLTINEEGLEDEDSYEYARIDQLLARADRLLILGSPGSGKTTLLQWIAVNAVTNSFPTILKHLNDKIPFFIRLREFAKTSFPSPGDFVRQNAPMIAAEEPEGWTTELLRSGRALVLIDGVDELPENRRSKIYDWIDDLITNFPKSIYIVTSRPYAAKGNWLEDILFTHAELQPMNNSLVNEFIAKWHRAVSEELTDPNEKSEMVTPYRGT